MFEPVHHPYAGCLRHFNAIKAFDIDRKLTGDCDDAGGGYRHHSRSRKNALRSACSTDTATNALGLRSPENRYLQQPSLRCPFSTQGAIASIKFSLRVIQLNREPNGLAMATAFIGSHRYLLILTADLREHCQTFYGYSPYFKAQIWCRTCRYPAANFYFTKERLLPHYRRSQVSSIKYPSIQYQVSGIQTRLLEFNQARCVGNRATKLSTCSTNNL